MSYGVPNTIRSPGAGVACRKATRAGTFHTRGSGRTFGLLAFTLNERLANEKTMMIPAVGIHVALVDLHQRRVDLLIMEAIVRANVVSLPQGLSVRIQIEINGKPGIMLAEFFFVRNELVLLDFPTLFIFYTMDHRRWQSSATMLNLPDVTTLLRRKSAESFAELADDIARFLRDATNPKRR